MLRTDELRSEERAFLRRWLDDPRAGDVSARICTALREKQGDIADGLLKIFVHEVLAALEGHVVDSKALLKHADSAERLARFLRGSDERPHPPLFPNSDALISSLNDAVKVLRSLAKSQVDRGFDQVSRVDRDGSRARVAFMRAVGMLLNAFCGRFLDEVGIFLSDVAFPKQETTLDQLRSARRPTTRDKRSTRSDR